MICSSCRNTLLQRISKLRAPSSTTGLAPTTSRTATRSVATVPATKNAAPSSPPPSTTTDKQPPAATSSSQPGTTQPFSEPFFPSTSSAQAAPTPSPSGRPNASAPVRLTSSLAGGTPLTQLNYLKQPPKPLLALEDHEYPPWLWTLVPDPNSPAASGKLDGGVDVASMTKRSRAKYERKMAKLNAGLEKPVPVHEQSKDLVDVQAGEGVQEFVSRQRELTQSMRAARRKGIREANFLRSM